jgi:hypothetical protein
MTDGYAALMARDAALRKKLVLLLAILETCSPFYRQIDRTIPGSRAAAATKAIGRATLSAMLLMASGLVLGPAHLLLSMSRRRS